MAVANKLGEVFLRLLKKSFPPSSNLYKIFNKNNVKSSSSYMPNVANLIDQSNAKISGISNTLSRLNAIALMKLLVLSRGNVDMNV